MHPVPFVMASLTETLVVRSYFADVATERTECDCVCVSVIIIAYNYVFVLC